jgi:hypothetical protein
MGKRGFATAIVEAAAKKAKKTATPRDSDSPTIRNWDCSKFMEKDLRKATKEELLKDDVDVVCMPGQEATPTPPVGFRVMFMAFILHGLSFQAHDFLRGLVFAYGVLLHNLNPNTVLHIVCFIMLCKYFLGIEPHWALWKRIFGVRCPAPIRREVSAALCGRT